LAAGDDGNNENPWRIGGICRGKTGFPRPLQNLAPYDDLRRAYDGAYVSRLPYRKCLVKRAELGHFPILHL
jgi:hypothetical protein